MEDLTGRVAVVTGAASGIGRAVSRRFLDEGMKVVLADVESEALEREAAELQGRGADVLAVVCDVRDPAAVEDLARRTLSHYGSVHVVMNNAGVAPAGPMLDTTPADWRWIVDVNVLGVAYGVTTFGPILRDAGAGHIVNTASEAGLVTNPVLGMYAATKHAVVGMTESLYRELEGTGVGVHCLCPNLVSTRIFQSERNRDDGAAPGPGETSAIAALREAIVAAGIAPDQVATDVVDAIRGGHFWIFTHAFTPRAAAVRLADIEAGRNPTSPYEGIQELEGLAEPS